MTDMGWGPHTSCSRSSDAGPVSACCFPFLRRQEKNKWTQRFLLAPHMPGGTEAVFDEYAQSLGNEKYFLHGTVDIC